MVERTEEDKLVHAGIKVTLGGKEYEIKPLVIRESRKWRAKAAPFRAEYIGIAATNSDDPVAFQAAYSSLMLERIDQTLDLFFAYARDLDRKEIEDIATEEEIYAAYEKVADYAFPLAR